METAIYLMIVIALLLLLIEMIQNRKRIEKLEKEKVKRGK